ncbi:hypothetical protein DFH09DRAFT_1115027 [Mycena vulgaris]|nr:hypothetical protein DFH09DRAFT_1115027 [Mycena vulgaris]
MYSHYMLSISTQCALQITSWVAAGLFRTESRGSHVMVDEREPMLNALGFRRRFREGGGGETGTGRETECVNPPSWGFRGGFNVDKSWLYGDGVAWKHKLFEEELQVWEESRVPWSKRELLGGCHFVGGVRRYRPHLRAYPGGFPWVEPVSCKVRIVGGIQDIWGVCALDLCDILRGEIAGGAVGVVRGGFPREGVHPNWVIMSCQVRHSGVGARGHTQSVWDPHSGAHDTRLILCMHAAMGAKARAEYTTLRGSTRRPDAGEGVHLSRTHHRALPTRSPIVPGADMATCSSGMHGRRPSPSVGGTPKSHWIMPVTPPGSVKVAVVVRSTCGMARMCMQTARRTGHKERRRRHTAHVHEHAAAKRVVEAGRLQVSRLEPRQNGMTMDGMGMDRKPRRCARPSELQLGQSVLQNIMAHTSMPLLRTLAEGPAHSTADLAEDAKRRHSGW